MKLKEFNEETCVTVKASLPLIEMNIKGLFNFNKQACDLIGITGQDRVAFHQDEDDPQNWYVEKVKTIGFLVRQKDNITKGVIFNNSALAKLIVDSLEFEGKSGRITIAGKSTSFEKRTLWGLLFSNLINVPVAKKK